MIMRDRCVLVTGAGGFVGGHLCRALHAKGARVVGLARSQDVLKRYVGEQHVIDISDREKVLELIQNIRPDMVVHLAAAKNRSIDIPEYRAGYEANLLGALNLVEACQKLLSLTRFVYLGTCEEYGQQAVPFDESSRELPVSAYGVTKLAVTQLLLALARARGFPAVILRPTVVYGPGQDVDMFLSALIKSLVSGQSFGMTHGKQTRDFVFIDDMVSAIMRALDAPDIRGQVINISSALPVRIDELARKVALLIGPEAVDLLDFGARECRQGEAMDYWASNSRARELLGWSPNVLLEDGLRQTIFHFRAGIQNG